MRNEKYTPDMKRGYREKKERKAIERVPRCVEMEDLDGTFEHVIFRVEHVVMTYQEERDFYTRLQADACRKWLQKYAPESEYAK
jgi:hypothetical protein